MIYIYVLKCPLSGRPRYVGKTHTPKRRLAAHISKAKSGQTQHHCARWIRKLLEQGLKPEFEIVFHVPASEEWQIHEKRFIADYLLQGCQLTNLTGGGDGFYKADPELIAYRSKRLRAQRAVPENNERFRQAMRLAHGNENARIAHSIGQARAWSEPEKRAAFVSGMNTPDAKKRRSDATRRRFQDPAFAASHCERMRLLAQQPERLVQIRAAQDARWAPHRASSAERRAAREIVRQENYARFLVEQAERLKQRWLDEAHRQKMQDARWTLAKRAEQAARLAERREKMLAAMTPEVRAQQAEALKRNWAKRKAQAA